MKKTVKRLNLHRETVLTLGQLQDAVGGGSVISKPNASCFIQCVYTDHCRPTETCETAPSF